ncbi:MAG: protein TolQ [Deltaproteobacteria bacterium]|nr:MAG: protein TolQ [Deltaproteobacteria bacterium]
MQQFLPLVAAAGNLGTWHLIADAEPVVKGVMALLAAMSIGCWYIIGYKYFYIRRAMAESTQFMDSFWRSRDIEQIYKHAQSLQRSPISAMFLAGYTELAKLVNDAGESRAREADLENIKRALHKARATEATKLDSMIPFLATTGSSAPFIGLFGTVWGIMTSFREIAASGKAGIDTLAQPIGEALIATAIGLVTAIPAVMSYNYFTRRVRVLDSNMDTFEQDFLNIIRRHFLK